MELLRLHSALLQPPGPHRFSAPLTASCQLLHLFAWGLFQNQGKPGVPGNEQHPEAAAAHNQQLAEIAV